MAQDSSDRLMFPPLAARRRLRPANWAIIGIFIILAFDMIARAREFLMPVALGVLLFFVFVPFRRWMDRRGVKPGITAGIVVLGILATIGMIGFSVSGPAGQLIDDAPQISRQLKQKYEDFRENFRGIAEATSQLSGGEPGAVVSSVTSDPGQGVTTTTTTPAVDGVPVTVPVPVPPAGGTLPQEEIGGAPGAVATASGSVTASSTVRQGGDEAPVTNDLRVEVHTAAEGPSLTDTLFSLGPAIVSQTVFTLIFLFFLLASGDLLYLRIVQSFDSLARKRAAYEALRQIEANLGSYLGTITVINVGLGVVSGLVMWAWGMPSPLLWGIGAAVLNYIPYIGAALGYVGAALVALVVFDDAWTALLVGGTYFGLTAIEGQFVTPYFVSWRLQLNPVVVFLTVALWAWLWSVIGMVVAVPLLVVVRVLSEHIPALQSFGNFLAGESPPGLEDEPQPDTPAA
ncbi:AI-2E family transporter [Paracoccus sp. (in: a-proteobacteria)]